MLRSQWIFLRVHERWIMYHLQSKLFFQNRCLSLFSYPICFFPNDNLFFIVVYMCQKPSINVQKSKPSNCYSYLWKGSESNKYHFQFKNKTWLQWCLLKASKRLDAISTQELLSRCNLIPASIKIKRARGNFAINGVRECETLTTKLWK